MKKKFVLFYYVPRVSTSEKLVMCKVYLSCRLYYWDEEINDYAVCYSTYSYLHHKPITDEYLYYNDISYNNILGNNMISLDPLINMINKIIGPELSINKDDVVETIIQEGIALYPVTKEMIKFFKQKVRRKNLDNELKHNRKFVLYFNSNRILREENLDKCKMYLCCRVYKWNNKINGFDDKYEKFSYLHHEPITNEYLYDNDVSYGGIFAFELRSLDYLIKEIRIKSKSNMILPLREFDAVETMSRHGDNIFSVTKEAINHFKHNAKKGSK